MTKLKRRWIALVPVMATGVLAVAPVTQASPRTEEPVVRALQLSAHELHSTGPGGGWGDLRPFGRMVGDASVVGVGEATHGTHEFFTMQDRVFRYLVREKGFGTFMREVSWSSGLRLNEYVLHGTGDPRQIMREEFQGRYQWNTAEYLDLVQWMRAYNERHRNKIQFMGDDIGYPGPELFDRVTGYVQRHLPGSLAELSELYRALRPTSGAGAWMDEYPGRPLTDRRADLDRARRALDLVRSKGPGDDEEAFAWAAQHATVITQVFTLWSTDFADPEHWMDGFRYRDQAMADNTAWWLERTGQKIVVAAHNGHVAKESFMPAFPVVQGSILRERLGSAYLSVGLTFNQGSFTVYNGGDPNTVTVGPAAAGGNEYTLDQVRQRDFLLDTRTAPPAARDWLSQARPTRVYDESYPASDTMVALARSYDVVIHVHQTSAARLLS